LSLPSSLSSSSCWSSPNKKRDRDKEDNESDENDENDQHNKHHTTTTTMTNDSYDGQLGEATAPVPTLIHTVAATTKDNDQSRHDDPPPCRPHRHIYMGSRNDNDNN